MAQTAIPSEGLVERAAARCRAAPAIPLSAPAVRQQAAEAAESERPPGDRASVEARQAAIQMAAAGNTRTQVETHLRGFLRVADPTALLDQVFGPATGGEARVPWAITPPAQASGLGDRMREP